MVYLTQLADVARGAGLKVREVPGWQTRGRDGYFNPVGVLCHHTATGPLTTNGAVESLLVRGRSDLPGPLCQLGLERDGTVVVIAAGRANHAGTAKSSGTVGAGDGNTLYIGIEAYNSGVGEPWPAAQYDAYTRLCAAMCEHITGNNAQTVRAHRETSVTGKIDPAGIDMDRFRARVATLISDQEDPMADYASQLDSIEKKIDTLTRQEGNRAERAAAYRKESRDRARHIATVAREGRKTAREIAEDLDGLVELMGADQDSAK